VVIPTLDEEASIAACLASVGDDVEVVVSDGGSGDATLAVVRSACPRASVVVGPRGRGGQLNRGAGAATSPALLFLHADCRLPAGWLEAARRARRPRDCDRLLRSRTDAARRGFGGPIVRGWWRPPRPAQGDSGLRAGDQALFLRRAVFEELGGFRDIALMEDVDLVHRALRLGRLARLPLAVRTTARRFVRHPVRARLCTATFPLLYRWGVRPEALARWYGDAR
jgi:glycosyltransferase involved in cell wall biosynthesis